MFKKIYIGTEKERKKQANDAFKARFESEEAYREYKRKAARAYEARSKAKRLKNKLVVTDELLKSITYDQTS